MELFILQSMNQPADYDIIIAGAGAAGLSLLWHLLNSEDKSVRNASILVADQSLTPANDKTWCFWDADTMPFGNLVHHTWHSLEVKAHSQIFCERLKAYRYHCMRSIDYSKKILELAENQPNVKLLATGIRGFQPAGDLAVMETGEGSFTAKRIFQSALKPPGFNRARMDISLKQHFLGWEIESKKDLFDPDKATLMDFDIDQSRGVTFMYLLPFSANSALIEHTLFTSSLLSDEEYESEIRAYLNNVYSLQDDEYSIVRKEKGVIPMEDRRYSSMWCNRVYNIGTVGGLTKPSTGYTFTRIHRQSLEIVRAIEQKREPEISAGSSYRFRVYDMMLLWLLEKRPETSVIIFRELFRKNSFDRILDFLEEKTTFAQELKIFASLPYLPFFTSIWKMKHRIFTGA
jgi:lycopene beta-cyclase